MKLTEKELKRLFILVAREINDEEAYLLEIDTRIKELKTIQDKLAKEIDKYVAKRLEDETKEVI